jgi:hypothetical protein
MFIKLLAIAVGAVVLALAVPAQAQPLSTSAVP